MNKKYLTIGVIAIIAVVTLIIAANYQSIFKTVIPPKPVLVSSKADGSSSKLFDYSIRVAGEVRNEGGDGYTVVKVTVFQGEKSWVKTQQVYAKSYETVKFSLDFDEVKLMDSNPEYSVSVFALGNPLE